MQKQHIQEDAQKVLDNPPKRKQKSTKVAAEGETATATATDASVEAEVSATDLPASNTNDNDSPSTTAESKEEDIKEIEEPSELSEDDQEALRVWEVKKGRAEEVIKAMAWL